MLKGIKEQRTLVAFIFYILAIGLAILECYIESVRITFPIVIAAPILFFIYYILLSIMVDESKLWPLAVLFGICSLLFSLSISVKVSLICEVLEIALFVIEIITAFIVKFVRVQRRIKSDYCC